jgi:hypothetical protein
MRPGVAVRFRLLNLNVPLDCPAAPLLWIGSVSSKDRGRGI